MTAGIENYRKMVDQPWGKMFYEILFRQLDIPEDKRRSILDFGAGFCITADHYAAYHDVTALEPSEEMRSLRIRNDGYTLEAGGLDLLRDLEDDRFDVVLCHNVLEYAKEKEDILNELVRVLKPGGMLSVVKHNLYGRVIGSAVLADDPGAALNLLGDEGAENSMFGNREVYDNDWLISLLKDKAALDKIFGLRVFFGLSSNNDIKYTDEWYNDMLELETRVYDLEEFKRIAFFNHLIFKKK